MKVNQGRCHIFLNTKNSIDVDLEGACITSNECEKLLEIKIDSSLKFGKYISYFWNKISKQLNALCQVTGYMSLEKRRIVMKTFVEPQFNYCLLKSDSHVLKKCFVCGNVIKYFILKALFVLKIFKFSC